MGMTSYDTYVFFLCLIVFILLTGFSAICITAIYRLYVKLIRSGEEDYEIIEEAYRDASKSRFFKVVDYTFTVFLLAVFLIVFLVSLLINSTQNTYFENIPTYRVVQTGSMAKVHKKNSYLNDLGITDQIQTFDLIATYKMPKEEDIELYDIVVYEVDEMMIVHRIVGIEPPNESHPDEYYYLLQGDAVEAADRFPVRYSQMRAIYKGQRIPFVGSLVLFMQSPAGWLCILLAFGTAIITPIMEKKLREEKEDRLDLLRRRY
ncbi:MAG: hypothetical protein E7673_06780 [Ruminococcaceae bacterium]|nr:hypothetical protein [Oscillospiraceae bacterium]